MTTPTPNNYRSRFGFAVVVALALAAVVLPVFKNLPGVGAFTAHAASATISGTAYNTTETAALTGTAHEVKLRTSTGVESTSNLVSGTGAFSFASITVNDGDVVTIWFTGTASGSLVFRYGSGCTGYTDCTGLRLNQNRLTLATYDGTAVANSHLSSCDNDTNCSADPPGFDYDGGTQSLTLTGNVYKIVVLTGSTYAPGGNVSATQLEIAGTYTGGSETLSLSGTGTSTTCTANTAVPFCKSGTYTANTAKVVFTGTRTTMGWNNTSPSFYDLEIQGSMSGASVAATVTHNLTVANGATLDISGNVSALTLTDGSSVTCVGTCGLYYTVVDGEVTVSGDWSSEYNLTISTGASFSSSGTLTTPGSITVTGTATARFNNVTAPASAYTFCSGTSTTGPLVQGTLTMTGARSCEELTMEDGSSMAGSSVLTVAQLFINGSVTSSNPTRIYSSGSAGRLTINGAGSFSHTATLTYDGTGQINNTGGGTVSLTNFTNSSAVGSGTLTINGDVTVSGLFRNILTRTITQASGTITFPNGSTISNTGSTVTFYRFNIPAGATITANTDFSVAASAQFNSGSTFAPSSGTLTFSDGSTIENSGGSLTFSGLAVASSATVAASGSFAVGGTFTVNTGGTFSPAAASVISGAGTLTGSGTVEVTLATGTNDFTQQYTITNKTLSALTVDYAGTAQGVNNITYSTLAFSGTNATSVTATTTDLTVPTGGTFTPSAGTITIADTGLITGTGTLTAQNITLSQSASVSGTLGIAGTLTVPSGGYLEPNAVATRISGVGTLTGSGSFYVIENTAGAAAGGDLVKQYPITTIDLSALEVIYATAGCSVGGYTYYNIRFNAACNDSGSVGDFTVTNIMAVRTSVTISAPNNTSTVTLSGATMSLEGTATYNYAETTVTGNATVQGTGSFALTNARRITVPVGTSLTVTAPTSMTSPTAGLPDIVLDGTLTFGTITNNASSVTASISGAADGFYVTGTFNNLKTTGNVYTSTMILQDGATIYDRATAGSTFPNISIESGASVTASGSFPVSGTLTVNSGGTLTPTATSVISGAGTLTGSGTVKVTRATGTDDFVGQYSITNKTLTNLIVDFAGSGSDIDSLTYGNLKVSGSVTADTSPIIDGLLTVTGVLTPSTGSVSFGSNGSLLKTGQLTFYNLDVPVGGSLLVTSSFATSNLMKVDGTLTPTSAVVLSGTGTLAGGGTVRVTRTTGSSTFLDQYTLGAIDLFGYGLTVTYAGSGSQTMTPASYYNLTVTNSAVTGTASVAYVFTSSTTVGDAGTKIELYGNSWSIAGTPTFNQIEVSGTPSSQPTGSFAIASNGTLTVVDNGVTLAPTAGTITLYPGVTLAGTGTFTPYSLTLTGSGTTTLANNVSVTNVLTIESGQTLAIGSQTLTLLGNGTPLVRSGNISGNSDSTIEFASVGTSGTTVPAGSYPGLLKVNTSSNTFTVSSGTLTTGNTLDVSAGTLDLDTNAVTVSVASVSIDGTLEAPDSGQTFTVSGDWQNAGTFNHNNGTVAFSPSGTSSLISGASTTPFYGVTMVQASKSLLIGAGRTLQVGGTFTIYGGSGNRASLRSDTQGQTFTIDLTVPAYGYNLNVRDIACAMTTQNLILDETSLSQGNIGPCVVISGSRGGPGAGYAPIEGSGGGTPTGGGTNVGGGPPVDGGSGGGTPTGGGSGSGGGGGAAP